MGCSAKGWTLMARPTCNVDAVLLGAKVNRGQAVLGLGVGVSLVLQEQVGHVHVALLGGQMQGREAGLET